MEDARFGEPDDAAYSTGLPPSFHRPNGLSNLDVRLGAARDEAPATPEISDASAADKKPSPAPARSPLAAYELRGDEFSWADETGRRESSPEGRKARHGARASGPSQGVAVKS